MSWSSETNQIIESLVIQISNPLVIWILNKCRIRQARIYCNQVEMFFGFPYLFFILNFMFNEIESIPYPTAENILYHRLMQNYEASARPVVNYSTTVNVYFNFQLTQILDLSEKNKILTTTLWIEQVSFFGFSLTHMQCSEKWISYSNIRLFEYILFEYFLIVLEIRIKITRIKCIRINSYSNKIIRIFVLL